jgi:hypothetical protein
MKWYKKQMDELKKTKPELFDIEQAPIGGKIGGHSVGMNKARINKTNFSNPVAIRNLNRPKTDSK